MSKTTDVVEVEGLRKTYKPKVRALDGLSLSVAPGSVFALLGPNGAGKTTTVRILTTLSRPGPVGNRRGGPAHWRCRPADRLREPGPAGQDLRDARPAAAAPRGRAARAVRAG